MTITFPRIFTSGTIHEVFATLSLDKHLSTENVWLNLSSIEVIDTEAAHYLVLVPLFLKTSNDLGVNIILPHKQKVVSYLDHIGILDILRKRCDLYGNSFERESRGLKSFSKTYFVEHGSTSSFFSEFCYDFKELLKINEIEKNITPPLAELTTNIFDHSELFFGCVSVHRRQSSHAKEMVVAVTDIGIGIKKSLLKSVRFQTQEGIHHMPDVYFLQSAIQRGVSSTDKDSRGFGLHIVSMLVDELVIRSGTGCLRLYNYHQNPHKKKIIKPLSGPWIPGTSITTKLSIAF